MRLLPLLAVLLFVPACVSEPAPPAVPRPLRVAAPPPLPTAPPASADWRDWPMTPGDWTYRRDATGSIALYGAAHGGSVGSGGGGALLTLRCDRTRGMLYLARAGAAPAPLTVRTSTIVRTLAVRPAGGAPASMAVALAPNDGLLDALAFSRGRFVVEQAGAPTLVVPAWAEVPRVTEDCRR